MTEKKSACWSVVLTADQSGIVKAAKTVAYVVSLRAVLMVHLKVYK